MPWNHRYKGHREAFKFNAVMYNCIALFQKMTNILAQKNENLGVSESGIYPTSSEVSAFNYVRNQIRHKEYLLMRDSNKRWFV
jgi:hypothetical protein